jgi:subtilisin family serine protease
LSSVAEVIELVSRISRGVRKAAASPFNQVCRSPSLAWSLFAASILFVPSVEASQSQMTRQDPLPAHANRLLIHAKPGKDLRRLHVRHGNRLLRKLGDLNVELVETCKEGALCQMIERYAAHPDVEFVEPDYFVSADAVPNDPGFVDGKLWSLQNTGQMGGKPGADMQAVEAWSAIRSAYNVIVAVVDSGVRYTHEDLAANMWRNPREIPGNGIDDDGNGYVDDVFGINAVTGSGDPMDDYGHGTHVAGIIGALGDNRRGSVGVAWRVRIMACKFMGSTGRGAHSDAIQSIEYARKHGASIINLSWGGNNYSAALQKAISAAMSEGIIVVAAAGNQASDNDARPFYPASFALDNLIAVAASTRHDLLAVDFSNYGARSVHVAAPGSDIYSTWHTADNAYVMLTGTSMAAPHVAGLLALMKVRFPSDSYQKQIRRVVLGTDPMKLPAGRSIQGGRINMRKALALPPGGIDSAAPLISLASGQSPQDFRFKLSGVAGHSYTIEASQNLTDWTPVLTNRAPSSGAFLFKDPSSKRYVQRYYRARLVPPKSVNQN